MEHEATNASELRGIDSENLNRWFTAEIEGAVAPLRFEFITGGHSNLTYRVEDAAGHVYVLRRPPTGAVLATAHDMAREHRIIAAVAGRGVPVPPALGLCEDTDVNGAPFYVMAYVPGVVLTDHTTALEHFDEAQRRRIGDHAIEVLATLHNLDPDAIGLGDLGRKEAYIARQLKRWHTQWEKTRTRDLPQMEEAWRALQEAMPEQVGAGIVHGDYRLGNMLIDEDGRIAAVLDWELCTLGDPLADLGYVLNNWTEPGEVSPAGPGAAMSPTLAGGFPSRVEFLARYGEATGRDVGRIDYYRAFQYWRLAAIIEGVLARYTKGVMGSTPHESATKAYRRQVENLAEAAISLLERLE